MPAALFLIASYSTITILTILLLSVIVKFVKDKSDDRRSVRDKILVDVAVVSGVFVAHFASANIVRAAVGQFRHPELVQGSIL